MEKLTPLYGKLINRLLVFMVFLFTIVGATAQTPTHYPTGTDPVRFNLVNILLFIVFPVLLVVIWIWIRRSGRKKDKEQDKSGD